MDATPGDLATALKDKAVTLCLLERTDQALPLLNKVIQRHQYSRDTQEKAAVDKCLYNKAFLLNAVGSRDEAIALYDKIATRNAPPVDIESRQLLAQSFLNKGQIAESKGTEEALAEAITCYELVIRTRDKYDDPMLNELAAKSMLYEAFARFAIHRGFVQTVSWWGRRSIFKRLDRAIILLAEFPHDSDSSLLLAARAFAMKAHLLGLFGNARKSDKFKRLETIALKFGAARAKRIVSFMEAEHNLESLAAFTGTKSMGIVLRDESGL